MTMPHTTATTTMFLAATFLAALAGQAAADGGGIRGKVKHAAGSDQRGVVVYLEGAGLKSTVVATPPAIRQKDMAFTPSVQVVTKGSTVAFPNDDRTMHNVFSRTKGNAFDLGHYKQGTAKGVKFDTAGTVDVYCNIHPKMVASVLVVENDFYVAVGADGGYELKDVPAGTYELVLWTPYIKPVKKKVTVKAGGVAKLDLELPAASKTDAHTKKDGSAYGRYK